MTGRGLLATDLYAVGVGIRRKGKMIEEKQFGTTEFEYSHFLIFDPFPFYFPW